MLDEGDHQRERTAFVLAGGGSLGAIQVGMLEALVEADIRPDFIIGTSVGSINAAYFAGRPTAEGVAELRRLWATLRRSDVFPFSWKRLFGLVRRRDFVVDPGPLRSLLGRHLRFDKLEHAPLPLHVVATEVVSGLPVVLSRGDAVEAVLASCAIPAAFAPVAIGTQLLCDGAVATNTPVRIAAELGARRIFVLPTGFACAPRVAPSGAIASALHAITLLTARQLVAEVDALASDVSCHVLPPVCPLDVSPFDFTHSAELMDTAYALVRSWIGTEDRARLPDALRPHSHDRVALA